MRDDCILLTGGAGFIGSHVVERLLAAGKTVVNLDLLTYAGNLANLTAVESHPGYRFVHGDLGDRGLVAKLLEEFQPSVVFNIAAESHVDRSIDDASAFLHTNVTAVHAMLDTCLAYWRNLPAGEKPRFRFIQMSTDEVYGSIAEGVFTEESNFEPNSPYAASKAAGDHFVRAFRVTFGLPTLIVHASNTYGPRQFPEKLIPHMVLSATAGKQLPSTAREPTCATGCTWKTWPKASSPPCSRASRAKSTISPAATSGRTSTPCTPSAPYSMQQTMAPGSTRISSTM